jgi:PKD repeat protein
MIRKLQLLATFKYRDLCDGAWSAYSRQLRGETAIFAPRLVYAMKKMLTLRRSFFLLLLFVTLQTAAQLSGIVTINSGSPASTTNFQSFTTLAAALNSGGVSGPLTVNVTANSGPYNEQPIFNAISGTSATNTITVNGNNNLLSFNSGNASKPFTLLLNGADHMFFNNLIVQALGATYALGCVLTNGADNNYFTTCQFSSPANAASGLQMPLTISGSSTDPFSQNNGGSNNTFYDCSILNGFLGVSLAGSPASNNSFVSCSIRDWYAYGIRSQAQQSVNVFYCSFSRPTTTIHPASNSAVTALHFGTPTVGITMNGIKCMGNCVRNLFGGTPNVICGVIGINFQNPSQVQAAVPANNTFSNNLFSNLGGNAGVVGLYLIAPNGFVSSNTVIIDKAQPTGTNSPLTGLYFAEYQPNATYITNNYFHITQGPGQPVGMMLAYVYQGTVTVNNNRYYIASAGSFQNCIGYSSSTGYATSMSQWQAGGYDLQGTSYSSNPNFNVTSSCGMITPLPVANFSYSPGTSCAGESVPFTDISGNNPYAWSWSVSPSNSVIINTANTQNPQISFGAGGIYTVNLTASNVAGPALYSRTIAIASLPTVVISPPAPTICAGSAIQFTAMGANTFTWKPDNSTGDLVTVTPSVSTTYSCTGESLEGCMKTSTVFINVEECLDMDGTRTADGICVFPNPAQGQLYITGGKYSGMVLIMYNTLGEVVFQSKFQDTSLVVDIAHLPAGIYFLNVATAGRTKVLKVIKE